jgi:predicted MFS family arabinose efflux permease
VVFVVVLATLSLTTTTLVGAAAVLLVWGAATWAMNPPVQTWLLQLATSPAAGPLLLSVNTSALYLGIGLSGVFGGVVIVTAGITALPLIAAAVGAVGLLLLIVARKDASTAARSAAGAA